MHGASCWSNFSRHGASTAWCCRPGACRLCWLCSQREPGTPVCVLPQCWPASCIRRAVHTAPLAQHRRQAVLKDCATLLCCLCNSNVCMPVMDSGLADTVFMRNTRTPTCLNSPVAALLSLCGIWRYWLRVCVGAGICLLGPAHCWQCCVPLLYTTGSSILPQLHTTGQSCRAVLQYAAQCFVSASCA